MPRIGGKRKKTRTHKEVTAEEAELNTGNKIPKSFVVKRGKVPGAIKETIQNMREVMYPNTAMKLKESGKNKLKDFSAAAGTFGVTHMMLFSSTEEKSYLRFCKLPEGPTLTFRIMQYSTETDIRASQRKPKSFAKSLMSPLLILNGFPPVGQANFDGKGNHYSIAHSMIQSMFPPLDPVKTKIDNMTKAVLFNLDQEKDVIEFRYYGIHYIQAGVNKKIRNLISTKGVPNLKNFNDISDYILRDDYFSEVDMEEIQTVEDAKSKSSKKVSIRLSEIGPRLQLKLIKIEEGILKGNVVYHRLIKKTPKQVEEQRNKLKEKLKRKEESRAKMQEIHNAKLQKKLEKKKKFATEDKADEDDNEEEEQEQEEEKQSSTKKKNRRHEAEEEEEEYEDDIDLDDEFEDADDYDEDEDDYEDDGEQFDNEDIEDNDEYS